MKKIAFLFSLAFLPLLGHAQNEHPAYLGISIGNCTPIGDFADNTFETAQAGAAMQGFSFDLNAGYRFAKHLGVLAMVRRQTNKFDTQAWADFESGETNSDLVKAESDNWRRTGAMAGVFGVLPLGLENKVALEGRVMGGFMSATSPKQMLTIDDFQRSVSEANASSFAYLGGLGLVLHPSSRLTISLTADYTASSHDFTGVEIELNTGQQEKKDFTRKIETLTVAIGARYRFW